MPDHATFTMLDEQGNAIGEPFPVLYNPTEYTLNKGVQLGEHVIPGLDSPVIQFVRGQPETLSFDLFFDSTDSGEAVTKQTDQFYRLVKMRGKQHAPPVCKFAWGGEWFPGSQVDDGITHQKRTEFKCVVESVRQRFTFFDKKGMPLRAVLTIALREYKTLLEQLQQLNLLSGDHTHVRAVRQGETLASIASDAYGDARQWRRIALANGINDPLSLVPGTLLEIPRIEAAA